MPGDEMLAERTLHLYIEATEDDNYYYYYTTTTTTIVAAANHLFTAVGISHPAIHVLIPIFDIAFSPSYPSHYIIKA